MVTSIYSRTRLRIGLHGAKACDHEAVTSMGKAVEHSHNPSSSARTKLAEDD